MGPGGADDVRRHKWFDSLDWDALHARKLKPPRKPKDDSAKRLKDLVVSQPAREPPPPPARSHACIAMKGGGCWAALPCTPYLLRACWS